MARKLVLFTSFSLLFNTPLAGERDFTAAPERMAITISALAKTMGLGQKRAAARKRPKKAA